MPDKTTSAYIGRFASFNQRVAARVMGSGTRRNSMPVGLADIEQGRRTDRTTVVVLSYIGKDRGHLIANGNFDWNSVVRLDICRSSCKSSRPRFQNARGHKTPTWTDSLILTASSLNVHFARETHDYSLSRELTVACARRNNTTFVSHYAYFTPRNWIESSVKTICHRDM